MKKILASLTVALMIVSMFSIFAPSVKACPLFIQENAVFMTNMDVVPISHSFVECPESSPMFVLELSPSDATYELSISFYVTDTSVAAFLKVIYCDNSVIYRAAVPSSLLVLGWNTLTATLPRPSEGEIHGVRIVGVAGHRDDDGAEPWVGVIDENFGTQEGDWHLKFGDGYFEGKTAEDLGWYEYEVAYHFTLKTPGIPSHNPFISSLTITPSKTTLSPGETFTVTAKYYRHSYCPSDYFKVFYPIFPTGKPPTTHRYYGYDEAISYYEYAGWLARGEVDAPGDYVTGKYHIGQDIKGEVHDPVYAIADGEIVYVSTSDWGKDTPDGKANYAYLILHILPTGEKFLALYGHVQPTMELKLGTRVLGGQQFAQLEEIWYQRPDDTWYQSPTHLHFGIRPGSDIPPSPWGAMPLSRWPEVNGFVDPIKWLLDKYSARWAAGYWQMVSYGWQTFTVTLTAPSTEGTYKLKAVGCSGHGRYNYYGVDWNDPRCDGGFVGRKPEELSWNFNEIGAEFTITVGMPFAELVKKYFPHLIFDENEKYYPTNFYYDDQNVDNNPSNYNSATWPKTAYVHTVQGYWEDKEYLAIEYWFYYVRDAKAWDIDVPFCMLAHDHDWESVYVFLEKIGDSYTPSKITYFKHMYMVGISWEDYYVPNDWNSPWVEKIGETHPVIYVALSSHASYQKMLPYVGVGLPLYHFLEIPIPEFVGGGIELDFDDLEVVYVSDASTGWPNKFGECVDAPWRRTRWNDPWSWMRYKYMLAGMSVVAASPVNLLVIDPNGRRIGYDPRTGTIINEIPEANYLGPGLEPQAISISEPLEGGYTVILTGTNTGIYNIAMLLTMQEGYIAQTYTGQVEEGEVFKSITTVSANDIASTPPLPVPLISTWITDSNFNNITSFRAVFTPDDKTGNYKLTATNPGQFYYNIAVNNTWLEPLNITVTYNIDANFTLKGAMPIHIYADLNRTIDITSNCTFLDNKITAYNVPSGGIVYVTIHLDYALKGTRWTKSQVKAWYSQHTFNATAETDISFIKSSVTITDPETIIPAISTYLVFLMVILPSIMMSIGLLMLLKYASLTKRRRKEK